VSDSILEEAEIAGDRVLEVRGQVWRFLARLDRGDLPGVRQVLAELERLGAELSDPLALWHPAMAECTLALLAGRIADAERAAFGALAIARRLELTWAVENFGIQLHQIRREQGRLAELEEATTLVAKAHDAGPVWQLALADLNLQLGRADVAAAMFSELSATLIALHHDLTWIATMSLAADLCIELGDDAAAAALYAALLPYAEHNVVIGPGVACMGSASRQLGGLATLLGLWDDASRHLDVALTLNTALEATPWIARTHLARARLLGAQGLREQATVLRDAARSLAMALDAPQLLATCDRADL
jgi:tetratricopeptide (TPR) repeat protein